MPELLHFETFFKRMLVIRGILNYNFCIFKEVEYIRKHTYGMSVRQLAEADGRFFDSLVGGTILQPNSRLCSISSLKKCLAK